MEREQRNDGFTAIEDRYAGYEVYDRDGDKIGKVDDLFVDENDRRIDVSVDKATAKDGPSFDDDEDITPEYEERVYSHYGLQRAHTGGERGEYGDYYGDEQGGRVEHDRGRRGDDELRV